MREGERNGAVRVGQHARNREHENSRGRGQAFQAVWVNLLGLMTVLHGICCMFGGLMASILSQCSGSNMDVKKAPAEIGIYSIPLAVTGPEG